MGAIISANQVHKLEKLRDTEIANPPSFKKLVKLSLMSIQKDILDSVNEGFTNTCFYPIGGFSMLGVEFDAVCAAIEIYNVDCLFDCVTKELQELGYKICRKALPFPMDGEEYLMISW